ncbi:nucleotidyltransferase domain-containing protein (plasmid) [Curtobacterium sp. MCBD17_035]|uniref:nucleotidyltransferase domain-containing protein n=1 Tax=Curtobacterium sp. MCBD17_035 TaxID=2175673 RepID=UPI000DA8EF87|nr:nucleotidyltransferase domain-containing protein [Curtobacterium sp. MCBD17_035]WIB69167.1 nucleotidyltransferase domain-containing protein [Curtobacterium sp. MCBD17_035]
MFDAAERSALRASLIAKARADPSISGAALVGSAARDAEDDWSDIDLVLQLAPDADEPRTVDAWTALVGELTPIADTFDLFAAGVRYRVFLLASSLQIDLSFWPHDQFRATDSAFQLLFGSPTPPSLPTQPDQHQTIGMGWLYALHARSALAREKCWQASMMLDELRSSVITLMCLRHGLNPWHGRDVDRLPDRERMKLEASRAPRVSGWDLDPSRCELTRLLFDEVQRIDHAHAAALRPAFQQLWTPLITVR